EAAALAERPIGDAHVSRVVVAAGDGKERDDRNPKAFHGRFDAAALDVFIDGIGLKVEQFR
ncbi:MAG: hypothetical protein WCE62_14470, partial [Polyangiales bacterium]